MARGWEGKGRRGVDRLRVREGWKDKGGEGLGG